MSLPPKLSQSHGDRRGCSGCFNSALFCVVAINSVQRAPRGAAQCVCRLGRAGLAPEHALLATKPALEPLGQPSPALPGLELRECGMCWLQRPCGEVSWDQRQQNHHYRPFMSQPSCLSCFACKQNQRLICQAAFCPRAFDQCWPVLMFQEAIDFCQQLLLLNLCALAFSSNALCMFD